MVLMLLSIESMLLLLLLIIKRLLEMVVAADVAIGWHGIKDLPSPRHLIQQSYGRWLPEPARDGPTEVGTATTAATVSFAPPMDRAASCC